LLTFGHHVRDTIQFFVGETEEEGYGILPYSIKLMEDAKGKVEVDELKFGILFNPCILHNFTLWIYKIVGSI
jgi:hypothetical protein